MTQTEPLAAGLLQDLERLAGFKFNAEARTAIMAATMQTAMAAISRATMSADLAWQLTQEATAAASRTAAAEPPKAESGEVKRLQQEVERLTTLEKQLKHEREETLVGRGYYHSIKAESGEGDDKKHIKQLMKLGKELRGIIRHCSVHSAYRDCGREHMTTEQKNLYDNVCNQSCVLFGEYMPEPPPSPKAPAASEEPKPVQRGMNCACLSGEHEHCTCGYEWRVKLQTEQTMHAAWRKRAEEAEAENLRLTEQVSSLLDTASAYKAARETTSSPPAASEYEWKERLEILTDGIHDLLKQVGIEVKPNYVLTAVNEVKEQLQAARKQLARVWTVSDGGEVVLAQPSAPPAAEVGGEPSPAVQRAAKTFHNAEAANFLKRLRVDRGAIVSSADCSTMEIAFAQKERRWYVDEDGMGYVMRMKPWREECERLIEARCNARDVSDSPPAPPAAEAGGGETGPYVRPPGSGWNPGDTIQRKEID